MTVRVLTGDCREVLATLPDESVHCVVTSPPYWGLRCYGVDGQLGQEKTPEDHVAVMVDVFRHVRRVLRKDGTLWLNYGDSYAGSPNGRSAAAVKALGNDDRTFRDKPFGTVVGGLKPKDLVMMPARIALALQADGWWLRSEIVWAKPNPMPESITDRPTSSHEKMFLFARSARYFYDAEAVRTPYSDVSIARLMQSNFDNQTGGPKDPKTGNRSHRKVLENIKRKRGVPPRHAQYDSSTRDSLDDVGRGMGANLRNVWHIATHPYPDAHFATFPTKLVEPCIKAGTSEKGVCPQCGDPWVRLVERDAQPQAYEDRKYDRSNPAFATKRNMGARYQAQLDANPIRTIGWEPSCGCMIFADLSEALEWGANENEPHNPMPCVVLDPFGGSGTVGLVADRLGRDAILIELNPEYADMARARITQDSPLFAEVGT